jgi:carboxypeptidase family protein/TonB-dependent receptor-like protein
MRFLSTVRVWSVLCAGVVGLFSCMPVFSQVNQGRILGAVTDQSGGVIVGAIVTVTDTERGISRTLMTDDSGEYNAPNLTPGTYAVRGQAKGFKALERPNILLEVGHEIRVDLSLQPGEQTQTVTVTEAVPLVETTNATLGGTLSHESIIDLPLNGRNYQNLLMLRPGTVVNPGGNERQSTNGLRGTDNVYLVDGLANDEVYTGLSMLNAPTLAGDVGVILPMDSIQEFGTSANNKAETGLKPGGVVNVGIKAGTNDFHGSAFAFGRGTNFNARNFFNTPVYGGCQPNQIVNGACPLTPISLEQWGATLGGPIKKDKLFWFAAYEQQLYTVGQALPNSTPVVCGGGTPGCGLASPNPQVSFTDALNSLIASGKTVGPTAGTNIAAYSLLLAGCPTSLPATPTAVCTGGLFAPNMGANGTTFQPNLLSNNRSDNGVAKISYRMNDRNSIEGTFYFGNNSALFNDSSVESRTQWESLQSVRSILGAGSWTWTPSSNVVNELRAGYARYGQKFDADDIGIPVTNYVSPSDGKNYSINTGVTNPAFTGFPLVAITGFNMRLGGSWPKYIGPDNSSQFLDHISLLRGRHAIKFGGEINRLQFNGAATTNSRGLLSFGATNATAVQDYFTGTVATGATIPSILSGDPFRSVHNFQYAAFVQDDWRIRPRITVNLGVRYEINTVLVESFSRFGNFIPNVGPVQVGSGFTKPYNPDYNDVSPRLGIAWDIQGNGKTVLRAGGSLIYSQIPYISLLGPGNGIGLGTVGTGDATQVAGVTTSGKGNISVAQATPTINWNGSTLGGATIFPASALGGTGTPIVCGDGLAKGTVVNGVTLAAADASPCNMPGVDQNLRTPYVSTWTLDFQRAITSKISLDVAYVGTHGTKLLGFLDINQPPVGAGWIGNASGLTTLASCITATNAATYTTLSSFKSTLPGTSSTCQPSATAAAEHVNRPYTISCPAPIGRGIGNNVCLPFWQTDTIISNIDDSNYNALQVALTGRPTHGLSFNVAYTWSHALDDASSNFGITTAPDSTNPKHLQYGPSSFDRRNVLNISTTYQFPDKKTPLQLLEGWSLNSIVSLRGGTPWSPSSGDFSGTGDLGSFWNFVGNPNDFRATGPHDVKSDLNFLLPGNPAMAAQDPTHNYAINNAACTALATKEIGPSVPLTVGGTPVPTNGITSLENLGCYVQGSSVLLPPAYGTWPQNSRGIFRGPSFHIWDLSITKNIKIRERVAVQFRGEFFNVLNHPTFTNPAGSGVNPTSTLFSGSAPPNEFGSAAQTLDAGGQNPVVGAGGARSIQLGLKISF